MRNILIASVAALLAASSNAQAAEIKALITTAMDGAVVVLVPQFEKATGHKVTVSYDPSGGLARRLRGGEFADMILVASPELDKLIAEGKVVGNRIDVSRTGIGIAIRKGAPKPDVSTPEALKRTLLAAKSVGHTAPAGGGITAMHLLQTFEKLGVAKEVAAKTKLAAGGPNGRVSVLITSGEAEIAFQQVSELMSNPEVEVIGMLPDELQQITVNSAGIAAVAKEPDAARALIQHMTSPEALAIYKKTGLGL
ncbi:MAG: molybdate transport system substrate-binding protein [Acidimicrobiaceae bacterium]|jgi:molybdate transport system substrate-binding protein